MCVSCFLLQDIFEYGSSSKVEEILTDERYRTLKVGCWEIREKKDCTYWCLGEKREIEVVAHSIPFKTDIEVEDFQLLIACVTRNTGLIFMALSAITNSSYMFFCVP